MSFPVRSWVNSGELPYCHSQDCARHGIRRQSLWRVRIEGSPRSGRNCLELVDRVANVFVALNLLLPDSLVVERRTERQ